MTVCVAYYLTVNSMSWKTTSDYPAYSGKHILEDVFGHCATLSATTAIAIHHFHYLYYRLYSFFDTVNTATTVSIDPVTYLLCSELFRS